MHNITSSLKGEKNKERIVKAIFFHSFYFIIADVTIMYVSIYSWNVAQQNATLTTCMYKKP